MSLSQASVAGDITADISLIFVDLDGTLIATDLLVEGIISAVHRDFRTLYRLPKWVLKGRSSFKARIEECVEIDASHLPYRQDLLEFLRARKAEGVRIVLATASPRSWAAAVANELKLFDDIITSDAQTNLKGSKKLAAIEEYSREHRIDHWGYVGDDHNDVCIWKAASAIYVVARKRSVLKELQPAGTPTAVFQPCHSIALATIRALRPQQWIKNSLVFIPLIASHSFANINKLVLSSLAFVCYSACASSIYIANDLLDLDSDRCHPKKARRPFASGALPVAYGPPLSAFLFIFGMALSLLSPNLLFPEILLSYVILSTLYSCWLKTKPIIDVIVLAMLYTLRVFAGGAAAEIPISEWLMAFSLFLFTSLAFAKRHAELRRLLSENRRSAARRGYLVTDLRLLEVMGAASGYLAVLVIALYIHSPETSLIYRHPQVLWLVCPLLLYWVSRLWLFAARGFLDEDPLVYTLTDRVSLIVAVLTVSIVSIGVLNW